MKTYNLLKLLNSKEVISIDSVIKKRNKESLIRLWKGLLKKDFSDKKEELFILTFKEKYTKEKDYLLRNELRILNEIISNLIIEQDAIKNNNDDIYILERMITLKKIEEFESMWAESYKTSLLKKHYTTLNKLLHLKIKYHINFDEVSIKNYTQIIELIHKKKLFSQLQKEEQEGENAVLEAHAERVLKALNANQNIVIKNTAKKDKTDDLIINYYQQRAEMYQLSGEKKITHILKTIKDVETLALIRPSLKSDISTLNASLGLEYFLNSDYKLADKFYKTAFEQYDIKNMNIDFLFNYFVNLIMIEKYEECNTLFKEFFFLIKDSKKLMNRFQYFNAIAYLFRDQPLKAFKLLTQDISQRPVNEYYYYRMVYAMVYHQLDDYENASRELVNILQTFRFRSDAQTHEKPIVTLLMNLVSLQANKLNQEKYKKDYKKIRQEFEQISKQDEKTSIVILRWAQWQLEKFKL